MSGMERLGPFTYRQGGFPLGQDTLLLGRFATLRRGGGCATWAAARGRCPCCCWRGRAPWTCPAWSWTGKPPRWPGAIWRKTACPASSGPAICAGSGSSFRAGRFDLVVSNPPYFPAGSGESGGSARMELCCTLTQVCAAAAFLLKNGGRFALVHRPERLAGLMEALGQSGLEPKRLQMVQHDRDKPPAAVLVEAVRQGRPGLSVLPTLILNER